MLAFRIESGLRCQLCGTAEWEWDPKQGGSKFAYEPVGHDCKGCYVKEVAQQTDEGERFPGRTFRLRPTRTVEWAQSMVKRQRREQRRSRQRGAE